MPLLCRSASLQGDNEVPVSLVKLRQEEVRICMPRIIVVWIHCKESHTYPGMPLVACPPRLLGIGTGFVTLEPRTGMSKRPDPPNAGI